MIVLEALIYFAASLSHVLPETFKKLLPKQPGYFVTTYGTFENLNRNTNEGITESIDDITTVPEDVALDSSTNQNSTGKIMKDSIITSFVITILVGLLPLGTFAAFLVYVNLNTSNVCSKWKTQIYTLPKSVVAVRFITDQIETVVIFLWFPLTMCIYFRFRIFRERYMKALYIHLFFGLLTVFYKIILYLIGYYQKETYYNLPSNIFFVTAVVWASYVIAKKNHNENQAASKVLRTSRLCIQFILGGAVVYVLGYLIVPWYNTLTDKTTKLVVTVFTPSVAVIPKILSSYFAGMEIKPQTNRERCFALAWYTYGVGIIIFRMMQSNTRGLDTFTLLCIFNGVVNIVIRITEKPRRKLWISIIKVISKTYCQETLIITQRNLPLEKRLDMDVAIQIMLSEVLSIIICQAYFALYVITNYNTRPWPVFKDFITRISIGIGSDLLFNSVCIFIQTKWNNVPVQKVWQKYWRVHVTVTLITTVMTIIYISPFVISVVETYADHTRNITRLRNCSLLYNV